jgi:ligand-binding SRPBCC domain-containing protein
MKTFQLTREQFLPVSLSEAWDFFSNPSNLEKITPNDMSFKVLTKLDNQPIYPGMLISYVVSPMMNIPMKWTTKIGDVQAPLKFVDTQLKGPYALWEHTHNFKEVPNGVQMTDVVKYALPMGFLGTFAHTLFVKKRLNDIFDYRFKILEQTFKK